MTTMLAISVWRKRAACVGEEYLFDTNPKKAKKELCNGGCPVKDQCFKFALIYNEFGIWGGTTKESREQLIEQQPQLRLVLIQEAIALGIFEPRVSAADAYADALAETQRTYQSEKVIDWNDPETWQFQEAI